MSTPGGGAGHKEALRRRMQFNEEGSQGLVMALGDRTSKEA